MRRREPAGRNRYRAVMLPSDSSSDSPSPSQPPADLADRPFDVFAVGNALVDVQAQVPEDVPASVGFEKGVMTLVDDTAQAKVLDVLNQQFHSDLHRAPGGSAANTVIGVAGFGGKAAFAGKTGDDELGQLYNDSLRQLGVEPSVEPVPGAQTGTSVILITPDADRTMLTNLAASATLAKTNISETAIRQAQWLYVEGYLFTGESTHQAALRAIELAREHGTKIAFTMSDPFVVAGFKDEFAKLIAGAADLVFCNLEEAQALTGDDDAMACAAAMHEKCDAVVITLGADGSLIMVDGEAIAIDGVECEAVDTTGAGDMYAAGILYGITNGLSWEQAGRLASHASSKIVAKMGPRLDEPIAADQIAAIIG